MSRQRLVSGHHCTASTMTSACHLVTCQIHRNGTEISANRLTGGESSAKVSARQKTSDCQLCKNCDTETDKPKSSGSILMTLARLPLSSLLSQCKYLEEENATMWRRIMEIEHKAMKSATQQLQEYDRAGASVHAVEIWTEHQIRDAEQDLELTREWREKRVDALRLQLQYWDEKIHEIQKNLQQAREYRDRGHSMKSFQAAELDRQIHVLSELHQDQAADVEALAQTEIENLLDCHQKLKNDVLEGVVEQHLQSVPLSLKRMCLQNQEMRSEIKAYQQMITGLQDDIKKLLENGNSLWKSWKEESDRLCRELLITKPSCSADEDVVLDIPMNQPMYI